MNNVNNELMLHSINLAKKTNKILIDALRNGQSKQVIDSIKNIRIKYMLDARFYAKSAI